MLVLFSWQCPWEALWSYLQWLRQAWLLADSLQTGRQLCSSCWNALPCRSNIHLRIRSVPCHVLHSFWTLCSSAWMGRRKKLSTIMTGLFSVREKGSQRGNWDSNMHLHLSQLFAFAVRCDSEDILVVELRRHKTSLLKLNQEAGT